MSISAKLTGLNTINCSKIVTRSCRERESRVRGDLEGCGGWQTRPTGRGLIPLIWILYFLVLRNLFLWFCGVSKRFLYFWLSDAVTDRKPTRHRPTRTWAGLPIQKLKKFRVKNIFPSSRKKSNNQKFWNSKKAKILIFLNPGEFRKFWFFEKISVLLGVFF